jgi:tRNA modification GTPase
MREVLGQIAGNTDTIVAISSPFGRSAIGLIRISGPLSFEIVSKHLPAGAALKHRYSLRSEWLDHDAQPIDDVVVTPYKQPRSYTGEDVVEIGAHGNPLILERILETVRSSGARMAGPGEFTWRAVTNGKMDLLQAEAIRDFIEARTVDQARIALRQLEGSLSRRIGPTKETLIDVIASFEAAVDFVEDDLESLDMKRFAGIVVKISAELNALSSTFGYGRLISAGVKLVIVGRPNVGKSSLFNRILGMDRAIVTEVPGTTRDVVSETLAMNGVAFQFCDTAGIREAGDIVEGIGIERTIDAITEADMALVVLDGSRPLDADDSRVLSLVREIPHLIVINKCDLDEKIVLDSKHDRVIRLSAKTGVGIPDLEAAFSTFVGNTSGGTPEAILTNARQRDAVVSAAESLERAGKSMMESTPPEIVLIDLYSALSELNALTGEVLTEDILDRVFSKFCIGK